MASLLERLKCWARSWTRDVLALWLAARDPRTPPLSKVIAGMVAAYALSPIDLIPDVIPVLGYLDDLVIVPLGITMAIRLIPPSLMSEFRYDAASMAVRPISKWAALIVVLLWLVAAVMFGAWLSDAIG